MSHYLIIRVEDKKTAETLGNSIRAQYLGFREYVIGNAEDVYYNASNVCEDISELTLLLKKEDEDEE